MPQAEVVIHVRFAPNGAAIEIAERPEGYSPQSWFNLLCDKAGTSFTALAGGRGAFALSRSEFDAIKAEAGKAA